jgi:hypothetical protein
MPKKLILDIDDGIWKDVLKFKIDNDLKNNNEAVVTLIKRGLYTGQSKTTEK